MVLYITLTPRCANNQHSWVPVLLGSVSKPGEGCGMMDSDWCPEGNGNAKEGVISFFPLVFLCVPGCSDFILL